MVLSTPQTQTLTFHLLLKQNEAGQTVASVVEMPDCRVTATTQEEAIAQLQQAITDHFTHAQVIPVQMEITTTQPSQSENPWVKYAGVFKDDPYFAKVIEQMNAERHKD
ncbi:type II toxin-antitoxin system HicB family antitoxin [Leptolyngbya sp. AN03gr2]|uniref:type II toxin-antitoxin system HicB family antitoxin n=1 Tax=unclassified Leptolyngbya TaxID=2650499 RepID=UPI003D3119C2